MRTQKRDKNLFWDRGLFSKCHFSLWIPWPLLHLLKSSLMLCHLWQIWWPITCFSCVIQLSTGLANFTFWPTRHSYPAFWPFCSLGNSILEYAHILQLLSGQLCTVIKELRLRLTMSLFAANLYCCRVSISVKSILISTLISSSLELTQAISLLNKIERFRPQTTEKWTNSLCWPLKEFYACSMLNRPDKLRYYENYTRTT